LNLLLDTNALIWILGHTSGGQLGRKTRQLIGEADNVYASSVSVLEIRIKTMLGKLVSADDLLDDILKSGFVELPFNSRHADALLLFPTLAKHDPFDRMLLAQASVAGATLTTSDSMLLSLGLPFVVDARA
jgi:PIN domain nuclease of toxin-antitoxin system